MKHLLTTTPFTRINEVIPWNDPVLTERISNSLPNLVNLVIDDQPNSYNTRYQWSKIQEAFVYVITETTYHYPYQMITEKGFKGITAKRPFIMVGPCGNLKWLKDQGFKTFDPWWNESYDSIKDPAERLKSVLGLIVDLCQQDLESLKKMCADMEHVLEHNFNWYKNEFLNQSLTQFKKDIERIKLGNTFNL